MNDELSVLLPTLKAVFGFDDLREAQKPIVSSVMQGRDLLAILKTSGGKSLCFQLPAIQRGGLTLVISPLISLMKDQVDALCAKGIKATMVNSTLEPSAIQQAYAGLSRGQYQLFYVAPERFQDAGFLSALATSGLHTIAIDEAHCASQWGHDFRPHYSQIGQAIRQIEVSQGKRFQRIAFTATATDKVKQDIISILGLREPVIHQQGFDRENLTYAVIPSNDRRDQDIEALLNEHPQDCTIIYCVTVKRVEALTQTLRKSGLSVERYHGKLSPEEKNRVQDAFTQGQARILVSTSAFGMGVDKSDIRLVIHAQMPGSLEAWYQEAGRAGRDGEPSKAVMFYDPSDRRIHRFFIEMGVPDSETLYGIRRLVHQLLINGPQALDASWLAKISRDRVTPQQIQAGMNFLLGQSEIARYDGDVYALKEWQHNPDYRWVDDLRRNNWQKVNAMQQWCETTLCRRWTVLKYFGDKKAHYRCQNCDTCHAEALSKSKAGAPLPYIRPVTLMNFAKAIGAVGDNWKAVLLGTLPNSQLQSHQEPWHSRFGHYALGDLERWVKRLVESQLLNPDNTLTSQGEKWIDGHWKDLSVIDSLCKAPDDIKKTASDHGMPIAMLHKWRKVTAYAEDTSEMAIGTEAFIRKVHSAQSFSDQHLAEAGVNAKWIKSYGASIRQFTEKMLARDELSCS